MGLRAIVYMTVKIKILALLPETGNFYQKRLTQDYESKKYSQWAVVKVKYSKVQ